MELGIFFEQQLARPWAEGDEQKLFQNALEAGEIADRIGVACAWAQEHHFLEEYSHSTAPEVFLGALSQRTKNLRLGHGVSLMPPVYNHPARVAERVATLDLVSGGRVEWGTGESSSRIELEGFGANYMEKRAMWAEGLRECARMLASDPYPGHSGKYFAMPCRNIVPKPVQRPHPPVWVACTNRDTMKMAARLGLGALTFSFMDGTEAKYWVEEYYETFRAGCTPIARSVNPRIAMLAGVMCHPDFETAQQRGLRGQQFFKWALAHYYRHGRHVPGRTNLWNEFQKVDPEPMAGIAAVGSPAQVTAALEQLEEAGVDQVIMLQQAGGYRHEHICESLELLGREVLPPFIERHAIRERKRQAELAPYIAKAMEAIPPIDADPPTVEAYPILWGEKGTQSVGTRRSVEGGLLWRMQVGGGAKLGAAK